MLNILNVSLARFAKLQLRDRRLVVVAAAIILFLIVNIVLLGPQQKRLKNFQLLSKDHKTELIAINQALAVIENKVSKNLDQMDRDRAALDELKKPIAEVNAFFGKVDATSPSQVRSLLRELLDADPGLTLVSLRTVPVELFYSPDGKASGGDQTANNSSKIQKTIYKHGVEINVKGNYMALLPYMENLQKYPKHLFWAEARLDVVAYPDSVLKLVIYTLSDQSSSPLR